jgi:hypothetical protein
MPEGKYYSQRTEVTRLAQARSFQADGSKGRVRKAKTYSRSDGVDTDDLVSRQSSSELASKLMREGDGSGLSSLHRIEARREEEVQLESETNRQRMSLDVRCS